jgi:N-acetylmuramoyl-L-alanine amidase
VIALFLLLATAPAIPPGAGPLVVIDPGHGGERAGTKNAAGVHEKAVTLAVAEHAKRALSKAGVRVMLTRESDQHVELDDRIALANEADAAVFVSVHANYAPVQQRRGAEIYILSVDPTDDEAAQVMHLENDEEMGGAAAPAPVGGSPLGMILQDLSLGAAHEDSARLAKKLIDALAKIGPLAPARGLKQAPFKVLRGAKMPAALVELGYLSNPKQGESLAAEGTQRASGQALADAILGFLARRTAER